MNTDIIDTVKKRHPKTKRVIDTVKKRHPKTKRVIVTLDSQQLAALDKLKKKTGASLAFTIRRALDRLLFGSKK